MKKLMFIINSLEKESQAIELGIDKFVYRKDIKEFIENVSDEVVKIIELGNYPREIPDDIIEEYLKVEDIFDRFYIVFTDYTGEVESQVEESRKDKDPILFGTFHDKDRNTLYDKFYYIGDWIDEYCDLTLEKMVNTMKIETGKNISHDLKVPFSLDELRETLDSYTYERGEYVKKNDILKKTHDSDTTEKNGSIFSMVKSWFK